jgi:hypothetical protein
MKFILQLPGAGEIMVKYDLYEDRVEYDLSISDAVVERLNKALHLEVMEAIYKHYTEGKKHD